jgi:hypothetical protein
MAFTVNRSLAAGSYSLREIFSGLQDVEPLIRCVGDTAVLKQMLDRTRVTLRDEDGYMYVNDEDGSLVIGLEYLKNGQLNHLYLDVIHELVHVRQFLQGRNLFDERYRYVDRPTEIEAYRCCVEEGRKMGMSDKEIAQYLYVEWITEKDHVRLLKTLGVKASPS